MGSVKSEERVDTASKTTFIFDRELIDKGQLALELTLYPHYYEKASEFFDRRDLFEIKDTLLSVDFDINNDVSILRVNLTLDGEPYILNYPDNLFLIEKNDSLVWSIDTRVTLNGRGNDKNKVRNNLKSVAVHETFTWFDYYLANNEVHRYKTVYADFFDAILAKRYNYLKKQQKYYEMSETAYRYIADEIRFTMECRKIERILSSVEFGTKYRDLLIGEADDLMKKIKKENKQYRGDNHSYVKFMIDLLCAEYFIDFYNKNAQGRGVIPEIDVLFHNIINLNMRQEIKDQLITFLFTRFETYGVNGEQVIENAIEQVENPPMKAYLKDVRKKRYTKSKIYAFRFEDVHGNVYTSESFRGKKVVFDFWFTGCSGCAVLHGHLVRFEEEIRSDEVIFVTVNTDRQRDRWISGLETGKYSNPDGLNLRVVNGKPNILTYYEFVSYPQLLIMDEQGYLVSYNVPKPINDKGKRAFKKMLGITTEMKE